MLILQASQVGVGLCLWAEASPESLPAGRRSSRRGKAGAVRPLPFGATGEDINAALAELVPGWQPVEPRTGILFLPTNEAGSPAASSPIVAPAPVEPFFPQPWQVSVLPLSPEQAILILGSSADREMIGPGVGVGRTLAFWNAALRFGGALVARQQFIPSLRVEGRSARAIWDPVVAGPDAARLSRLAAAMPHACRALTAGETAAPETPAAGVLRAFLSFACDDMVRSARHPVAPRPAEPIRRAKSAGRGKPAPEAPPQDPVFNSIHDQWLYALHTPSGEMKAPASDLGALAAQLVDWRRPIAASLEAPFRLCFRLEEPVLESADGDGNPWHVRFMLQAVDDLSLLVPAEIAWKPRDKAAAILQRGAFDPREYLLTSLGHASNIHPQIESSLRTKNPSGYDLDTASAYDFLTRTAWMVESAGFGVLLPAWWSRKGTKLKLAARASVKSPKMQGGGGLSLQSMVDVDWNLALGDEPITLEELQELARHKAALVRFRGQWVEMNPNEIQAAIDFWKKKGSDQRTVGDMVRMALGGGQAPGGLEIAGIEATGWAEELLGSLSDNSRIEELLPPAGLRADLRPYQKRGYSWLAFLRKWGLGACLADDMGLGKTVQVLALIRRQWEENEGRPVLVICPTSVVGNWEREAARFTPDLPVMVHHGLSRTRGSAFAEEAARHAIVLSSYALLHRDFEILKEVPWVGVVLDEAQNIKNPETKQAKAARSLPAEFRVALSGTPVENHVGDLWSIMEFLNPGFLGTQTRFKRDFFIPIQTEHNPEASDRLKKLTGPFVLRRLKTDRSVITDLPEKMEMKVYCNLTREQASLYAAVVKDAEESLDEAEGMQRRGTILATLMKLKQVCNHPAQFLGDNSAIPGRSGKLARLSEMLEEALEAGDRALIFTQFTEMGALIRRHLQETFGQEVLFLHGTVPKKARDEMVQRFQSGDHGPRLFILSLKAGGTGLNLTAANHVFHFDRWWNPAVENQATDRAFRIGQTRRVQVHKFVCAGTLEERIDEMIENKRSIAESVVGTGEGWLTELSTDELKNLFRLREDAVAE